MTLSIDIKTHGNISETGVSKNHEMNSEYIKNVEKSVEDKIENQINSVIESTLKNGYDIFYIKKLLKKEDVSLYNKIIGKPISSWLPDIEYDIDVEFNITHLGVQVK
jgi:hypothetical protein